MDDKIKVVLFIRVVLFIVLALFAGSVLLIVNNHEYRMAKLAIDCPAATEEE